VTVNQLGIVGGVATFGTLYLNMAGLHAGVLASAHAYETTSVALAALAILGGVLAAIHVRTRTSGEGTE
jgi:fluoride ion exporter CrcB/FEX